MAAASDKSSLSGPRRRSKRSRNNQSTNTFHDSKLPLTQVNSIPRGLSNSSVRRLYKMTESILVRIEALERFDQDHSRIARLPSGSPDNTMQISEEDANRPLYKQLEAALARILVLERRRDIFYRFAFKAADGGECIVRGCGSKSSLPKNAIRHFNSTPTPEHEVAAIVLQQTDCLQCGMGWRTPSGLAYHEKTVHNETRSSRMDTFKPFFEQPHHLMPASPSTESPQPRSDSLRPDAPSPMQPNWSSTNDLQPLVDSTPPPPLQQCQSGSNSVQLAASELMQPKWSGSKDLQPLAEPGSAYPTMQASRPEFHGLVSSIQTPMPSNWYRSYDLQRAAASATGDHSTQPPQPEFIWAQANWSSSNDLYHANHY
ncbi:hypothetical protein ABVK25_003000 [Lepraria finkii]|uniref:C2H2-type domain-containing protein n=1 Tax=Lepraria finkii TaxID=1340010 RepID=A0ABR4BFK1_9LECA